jgi:hypothetical protein
MSQARRLRAASLRWRSSDRVSAIGASLIAHSVATNQAPMLESVRPNRDLLRQAADELPHHSNLLMHCVLRLAARR